MRALQWFRTLLPLAAQALMALVRFLTAWRYRRQGRLEAQKAQLDKDHEILRKAADARRDVDHDAEWVRRDRRNRDAR